MHSYALVRTLIALFYLSKAHSAISLAIGAMILVYWGSKLLLKKKRS